MKTNQWQGVLARSYYSQVPRFSMHLLVQLALLLCGCASALGPAKLGWPVGTYGLPRSLLGCPSGKGVNFTAGARFQDLENNNNANNWSKNDFHLAGEVGVDIKLEFCVKTQKQTGMGKWPPGQYCILKKGDCPQDFFSGWILWHDEVDNNQNFQWGELPDGIYNVNTKLEFCCRSDAPLKRKVKLPTDHPFYLLRFSTGCQTVSKMLVQEEWLQWDMDDTMPFQFEHSSLHPYIEPPNHDASTIRLYFCFYYKPSQLKKIKQSEHKKRLLLLNKTKL